jgi:hypothetical protein
MLVSHALHTNTCIKVPALANAQIKLFQTIRISVSLALFPALPAFNRQQLVSAVSQDRFFLRINASKPVRLDMYMKIIPAWNAYCLAKNASLQEPIAQNAIHPSLYLMGLVYLPAKVDIINKMVLA